MGLFKSIVEKAPVANTLKFGYNENVVIQHFDKGGRLFNGMPVLRNSYITLTEVDPKTREIKASTEVFFWNITPNKFALSNFIDQYNSFVAIVDAVGKDSDKFTEELDKKINVDKLETLLSKKDSAKTTQEALVDTFAEIIKDAVGINGPLLKVKLTVNDKGFFQPGSEPNWILSQDSEEELPEITRKERQAKNKAAANSGKTKKKVIPDSTGKKKSLLSSMSI